MIIFQAAFDLFIKKTTSPDFQIIGDRMGLPSFIFGQARFHKISDCKLFVDYLQALGHVIWHLDAHVWMSEHRIPPIGSGEDCILFLKNPYIHYLWATKELSFLLCVCDVANEYP